MNKKELDKDKYENETFWVGLMLDRWEWDDQSCSTFRDIQTGGSEPNSHCSMVSFSQMKIYNCTHSLRTLCSDGKHKPTKTNHYGNQQDSYNQLSLIKK